MKKMFLFVVLLLTITLVEATVASLNVSWQMSSDALRPSSNAIMSLTITNAGSVDLTNIIVKATPGPYLTIISGDKNELGGLSVLSSTQASLSIKVDDNAISTNSWIYLEVDYYTGTSNYEKTLYVPVSILREPIIQIANVNFSNTPEPGKTVYLNFDLINEGYGDAKDVILSIVPSTNFIVPESSGEVFIERLSKTESKGVSIPISISPEISIGTSTIPIEISYYDETRSTSYNKTKDIGLKVSGNVDFLITVDSYNNFYYGRMGTVSVSIANRGSSSAKFISVKASSNFGSKEFYLGKLDSDDSDRIEITQDLSKASGPYPLALTLSYRDEFDNVYSIEKTLEVVPANASIDYSLIIVAIVAIAVAYWFFRKRKK